MPSLYLRFFGALGANGSISFVPVSLSGAIFALGNTAPGKCGYLLSFHRPAKTKIALRPINITSLRFFMKHL